jgi:hypothetical protein
MPGPGHPCGHASSLGATQIRDPATPQALGYVRKMMTAARGCRIGADQAGPVLSPARTPGPPASPGRAPRPPTRQESLFAAGPGPRRALRRRRWTDQIRLQSRAGQTGPVSTPPQELPDGSRERHRSPGHRAVPGAGNDLQLSAGEEGQPRLQHLSGHRWVVLPQNPPCPTSALPQLPPAADSNRPMRPRRPPEVTGGDARGWYFSRAMAQRVRHTSAMRRYLAEQIAPARTQNWDIWRDIHDLTAGLALANIQRYARIATS